MREKIKKNTSINLAVLLSRLLNSMPSNEIEVVAKHITERIGRNPDDALVALCQNLTERVLNFPNQFDKNGEKKLLELLKDQNFTTLFDVGANRGVWCTYASSIFPNAKIHAFEIVPSTYDKLAVEVESYPNIIANCFGLADKSARVPVYVKNSDLLSSIYSSDDALSEKIDCVECLVIEGMEYVKKNGINEIDILKIDVEGAEEAVILGFEPLIASAKIKLVQFEYNRGAIAGNFLLKRSYEFFLDHNYILGKLMPDGVQFRDYQYSHEDFIGPNYVACPRNDHGLIAAVRRD